MTEGFTGPGTDTSPASTYKASGTRGFVYDGSTPPSNGQVPTYDSTAGAYKPAAPSGGAGEVWSDWITLTDAQIKALPTTPFTLIAAPGAGRAIRASAANLLVDLTGDYTNVATQATLGIAVGTTGATVLSPVFLPDHISDGAAPTQAFTVLTTPIRSSAPLGGVFQTAPAWMLYDEIANVPLTLLATNLDDAFADQGDFTGGDAANRFYLRVRYDVVTLPV